MTCILVLETDDSLRTGLKKGLDLVYLYLLEKIRLLYSSLSLAFHHKPVNTYHAGAAQTAVMNLNRSMTNS